MKEKVLIFDSSTIITLALNNLLDMFIALRKSNGKFLVTQAVKREIIDRPLKIKKFELGALMIAQLLRDKVLEMPSMIGITETEFSEETKKFLEIANHTFKVKEEYLHIIDEGEASCFALSKICKSNGIKNILAIDERTARMLCEKPFNLKKLLEKKLHTKVVMEEKNLSFFKSFDIIRSAELCYVAYKKNLAGIKNGKKQIIDALLYATKSKGCAISQQEIEIAKKLHI